MEKFQAYVVSLLEGDISQFSAAHLREIIDSFRQPLQEHLADEIDTLLGLAKYDKKDGFDLDKLGKEAHKKAIGQYSLTKSLPVLMLNHDRTFEGSIDAHFPPMPAIMNWAIRRVAPCWHWGWWKFATCDGNQMPKSLPYM